MKRLEQEEPEFIISYNPEDAQSIKMALQEYADYVEDYEAFVNETCVVVADPNVQQLSFSFFQDTPEVHRRIKAYVEGNIDNEQDNIIGNILTETLLFACALRFPELENTIQKTLQSCVDYAKSNHDSYMWVNESQPFAIESLRLVADIYPQYGYLLAGFMAIYWNYHYPNSDLAEWADARGITDDTLKAFCYCENYEPRTIMLGASEYQFPGQEEVETNFKLLDYLRSSDKNYLHFKNILAQRCIEASFLHKQGFLKMGQIEGIVFAIMHIEYPCYTESDDFDIDDFFTQTFIKESADVEISELQSFIENKVKIARQNAETEAQARIEAETKVEEVEEVEVEEVTCSPNEESDLERQRRNLDKYFKHTPLYKWQELIKKSMREGFEVLEYIHEGKNEGMLENIPVIDIYCPYSNSLPWKEHEDYFDNEQLWNNFAEVLKPLYEQYERWAESNSIDDSVYQQIFLRLLEVIFRLNNSLPFTEEVKALITQELNLCESDEFNERYGADWFHILKEATEAFSDRRKGVNAKTIQHTLTVITTYRSSAIKLLPTKMFAIQAHSIGENDFDNDEIYDTIITAAILAHHDQQNNHFDELTQSAIAYLGHYNKPFQWNNLQKYLALPSRQTINGMEKGRQYYIDERAQQDYYNKKDHIKPLNEFVDNDGFITNNGEMLSYQESASFIKQILTADLTSEQDNIAATQKHYEWFFGYKQDRTQKLLYVAHLVEQIDRLENKTVSNFILKFAFEIAPVRCTHLLSKSYKKHRGYWDNAPQQILEMLDTFVPQGLSEASYWAYMLHEYGENHTLRGVEGADYKALLNEWITVDTEIDAIDPLNSSLSAKAVILEGYQLIARRTQQNTLKFAKKLFPEVDFKLKSDVILIGAMERKLQEKHVVNDLIEYFKHRFTYENHNVEVIDKKDWYLHPELINEVLHKIEVEQPTGITAENCNEKLNAKSNCGYIILQKQADQLLPIFGQDLIWMIQQACNKDNIDDANAYCIIIDASFPQDNLDEFITLSKLKDYKAFCISRCMQFLKGEISYSDFARLPKYGLRAYNFDGRYIHSNLFDTSILDSLVDISLPLQKRMLQMLALISHETLAHLSDTMEITEPEFIDLLLKYEVDKEAIFNYLLYANKINLLPELAEQVDVSSLLSSLKINDQLTVLSKLAQQPYYHELLFSCKKHKSAKVKKHVNALIKEREITTGANQDYEIADFGVYEMQGDMTPQGATAREPICTNQTDTVKAELGQFIGFRFIATDTQKQEVLRHRVVIKYPSIEPIRGLDRLIKQWVQNGSSNSNIFLGWHFEAPEELISGDYQFEAYDLDWKLIAKKTITVI